MSSFLEKIGLASRETLTLDVSIDRVVKELKENTRPWGLFAGDFFNDFGHEYMGTVTNGGFKLQMIRFSFSPFSVFKQLALAEGTFTINEGKVTVGVTITPSRLAIIYFLLIPCWGYTLWGVNTFAFVATVVIFMIPFVTGAFWSIGNLKRTIVSELNSIKGY